MIRTRWCGIALAVTLALAACGGGSSTGGDENAPAEAGGGTTSTEEPRSGGSVTFDGVQGTPANLDPVYAASPAHFYRGGAGVYFYPIFGALLYENWETGEIVPWLAESLEKTDATHWVLQLREGVTFTDGTPFDAAAVKFNWERFGATETAPFRRDYERSFASLDVAGPLALNITLKEPNVRLGFLIARYFAFVGSPTAIEADPDAFAQNPVGAGPFVVKSWDPTTFQLVATRNTTYWDQPRPYLDEVTIRSLRDPAQRYNDLVSGQADIVNELVGPQFEQAENAPGIRTVQASAPYGGDGLVVNTDRAPFDDPDARRAFVQAIDAKAVNEAVYGDAGILMSSMFQDGSLYFDADAAFLTYDPDAAQAGFDAYAAKHGEPMKIVYTTIGGGSNSAVFAALSAQLANYDNVTIEANYQESANYIKAVAGGGFDLAQFPFNAYDPLLDWQSYYMTGGSRNFGKYSNPQVDALLTQAGGTADATELTAIYAQVQQLLVRDDVIAWFPYQLTNVMGFSDRIGGAPYALNGAILWDQVWVKD